MRKTAPSMIPASGDFFLRKPRDRLIPNLGTRAGPRATAHRTPPFRSAADCRENDIEYETDDVEYDAGRAQHPEHCGRWANVPHARIPDVRISVRTANLDLPRLHDFPPSVRTRQRDRPQPP